jgi:hypothetical protein
LPPGNVHFSLVLTGFKRKSHVRRRILGSGRLALGSAKKNVIKSAFISTSRLEARWRWDMPRRLRIEFEGAISKVMAPGNAR